MHPESLRELRAKVLKQAKSELKMNLSLIEMLKGNTPLEDLANLREAWVEPLIKVVSELESISEHGIETKKTMVKGKAHDG